MFNVVVGSGFGEPTSSSIAHGLSFLIPTYNHTSQYIIIIICNYIYRDQNSIVLNSKPCMESFEFERIRLEFSSLFSLPYIFFWFTLWSLSLSRSLSLSHTHTQPPLLDAIVLWVSLSSLSFLQSWLFLEVSREGFEYSAPYYALLAMLSTRFVCLLCFQWFFFLGDFKWDIFGGKEKDCEFVSIILFLRFFFFLGWNIWVVWWFWCSLGVLTTLCLVLKKMEEKKVMCRFRDFIDFV